MKRLILPIDVEHRAVAVLNRMVPRRVAPVVWSGIRHTVCAVHGHEFRWHFEPDRLSLLCARCGLETPGWRLGPARDTANADLEAYGRAA